ncbi:hypothetical protein JYK14_24990 [Siccirubricoccus sp. KC 17139]|uniref:EF-hand domain-containing protein n=1 Tax=Siccirubricoccus soli TaxID=2899147 RepID=A0ABT1DBR9_9PROT|nr:hypothetical protein [Siccirubricoccus soli]MCO6419393.1 hypothetical protein [Siccirubricoccus soli]MCP2685528.1 hypothetical protein [Siccirubricoccus soli]
MKSLRLALIGSALLAVPALAQPAPPPAPGGAPPAPPAAGRGPHGGPVGVFQRVDADHNGRITWDESWAFVQQRFAEADRNRDGALVMEELLSARLMPAATDRGGPDGADRRGAGPRPTHARMLAMMFRALDANRDAKVTLEEVRPMIEAKFRALDANGDNGITLDEVPAPARHHHGPHGHGPQGPGMAPPAPPAGPQPG